MGGKTDGRHGDGNGMGRYTWGSAYACFRDAQLGTLWPSKMADFVVFSDNLLSHPASTTPTVLATFVGGVRAFPAL